MAVAQLPLTLPVIVLRTPPLPLDQELVTVVCRLVIEYCLHFREILSLSIRVTVAVFDWSGK
jgi:formate-dependent phosphoribosylglycinamide formyltransferase (GAR transformylase)